MAESTASTAASTPAAGPVCAPCDPGGLSLAAAYHCGQCKENCTIVGSKPSGKDPTVRLETLCATNRRNMERRVKRSAPGSTLRGFWTEVLGDKDKLAAWSRKMKKRQANSEKHVTMDEIVEEVKTWQSERRKRTEFISFATIEEDHPLKTKEEQLAIWRAKVKNAAHRFMSDGVLWISKAPKILLDQVQIHAMSSRHSRTTEAEDIQAMETAQASSASHLERFRRQSSQHMPQFVDASSMPDEVMDEAADALLTGEVGGRIDQALMGSGVLTTSTAAEMRAAAKAQNEQDKEDMNEFASPKASTASGSGGAVSEQSLRKLVNQFETAAIERRAKLDASVLNLMAESPEPKVDLAHIPCETMKKQEEEKLAEFKTEADALLADYKEKVTAWNKMYANVASLVGANPEYDAVKKLFEDMDSSYKKFFGKESHAKDYRKKMKDWKKHVADIEKEADKLASAAQTASSRRRRRGLETDDATEMPPSAKKLKFDIDGKVVRHLGAVDAPASFPQKAIYLEDALEGLDTFFKTGGITKLARWADNTIKKAEEPDVACELHNKKVLDDLKKVTAKLDSKLAVGAFSIAFATDKAELEANVAGAQFAAIKDNGFNINVTPFGLADIRLAVEGAYFIAGYPMAAVKGATLPEKISTLHRMEPQELYIMAQTSGFVLNAKPKSVLAIPPGHLILTYNVCGNTASYFRWSVYAEDHKSAVTTTIEMLLQAHAYLKDSDYKVFYDMVAA